MSKILLLETSGPTCSVAIAEDNRIACEYNIYGRNLHDSLLATSIKRLTSDIGIRIENIDTIALSAGPGSYTGLRIGGAVAKALSFDDKIKLVAVPTLDALAANAVSAVGRELSNGFVAIVPSHKDLVYYQEFDAAGNRIGEVCFTDSDEFNKLSIENKILAGLYPDEINNGIMIPVLRSQTAAVLLPLALDLIEKENFADPVKYEPIYIQEFEPKIRARI